MECLQFREQMTIKDYKDLQIWQKGIDIVDEIYSATDGFPKSELYGLTNQMRRASVSIPSNIAEGFARSYQKEYRRFLFVSLGSCAELDTQLIIANRRGYIEGKQTEQLADKINHASRMISSLISKL